MSRAVGWHKPGPRGRDLAALAVILVCALALHRDAILHGRVYAEPDTTTYYYPATEWLGAAVVNRSVPLWTPDIYGGFPLFADGEPGVFYPPNVVALALLKPGDAFVCLSVLRFFLAGAFCFAFLRVVQPSRLGALVGALTFAFGSFTVSQMHHVNVVTSAAWLPLILLFAELALRSVDWHRALYTALGGAALAMALLGVHVQPVLMGALALALYMFWRCLAADSPQIPGASARPGGIQEFAGRLRTGVAVGAAIAAAGLAMAAVQLLPLAELSFHTVRLHQGYSFGRTFALAPPDLVTLLFPYFFRSGGHDYWALSLRWETTLYVGIAPLLLASVGAVLCRRRQVAFFAFLALFSLLLALDGYSPVDVYRLLWHVPGFSFLRAPARFSLLFVFSVAALAAFGTARIQEILRDEHAGRQRRHLRRLLQAAAVGTTGLVIAVIGVHAWLVANKPAAMRLITTGYLGLPRQDVNLPSADEIYSALLNTLSWRNGRTALTLAFAFATLLLLAAWARFPRRRGLSQGMLAALVAIDLLCFAEGYHPKASLAELSAASGVTRFLSGQPGLFRVQSAESDVGPAAPNRLLSGHVASVDGYSSLEWARYARYKHLVTEGRNPKLLDLWNVRYLVLARTAPLPAPADRYVAVFQDAGVAIYENRSCLPRAFIVTDALPVDSEESALKAIENPDFDPARAVVLEGGATLASRTVAAPEGLAGPAAETRPALQVAGPKGSARVIDYGSTLVRIATSASTDAYLVLADNFYPAWQATVDGRPSTVYQADFLFRAVRVPAGNHTVVFRFHASSFRVGAAISLASLVLLGAFLIVSSVRHRRTRDGGERIYA